MTYAISVPTPFNDISELAENFASRVDDERLMLPHDQPIPEGEWVQFTVSLADGSPALAGTGRCTGAFDNGEDRAAEHRYDIVMDNLQLDEMAQIYFERVLQMRAAQMGEEPNTGQVEVPPEEPVEAGAEAAPFEEPPVEAGAEAAAFEEPPLEAAPEAAPAADDDFGAEATQAVSFDELEEAAQAAVADPEHAEAVPVETVAEVPLEASPEASPEAYAEPSAEAYAEPPADAYPEQPAEAYAEAPIEGHAEQPVEAYAQPADAGAWDEAGAVEPEELSGSEMLESVEEVLDEGAEPAAARSIEPPTELRIPEQSAIYELPPPSPPGQLPSPHATNGAVLTRRSLTASWSPEPALRHEPMPSSGLFQYAVGAGLPQPAEPPRPDLDPSLRLAPAPRPGDPHAAPAVMTAAASEAQPEAQMEQAYEPEAYEQASPEAAEPHFGADETMEGLGLPAEEAYAEPAEGYEDAEPMQADEAVVMDDEAMDASMNEAYPAIAEADAVEPDAAASDFDFEDLSEQAAAPEVGDETAVAVELPDDEERQ